MTFDSELDSKQTMLAKTAMARQSTGQQDYIFSVVTTTHDIAVAISMKWC